MRHASKFVLGALCIIAAGAVRADEAVYFSTNSTSVKVTPAITKMIKKAGDGATWKVIGYTDPRGSDDLNRRLRQDRADAVKQALIGVGVPADKIEASAGTPAPPNVTESQYGRLRKATIQVEGGRGPAVAGTEPKTDGSTPAHKPTKAELAAAVKAEREKVGEAARAEREAAAASAKAEREQKEADAKAEREQKAADREAAAKAEREQKGSGKGTQVAMVDPQHSTATQPGDDKGGKLEPIKLLYWRSLNHALWIIAKEKGFFATEGFDVTLEETNDDARKIMHHVGAAAGAESTSALEKGQKRYAAGAVCGFATHEAMARGDQIVDIGSMIMIPETLLMKKELSAELDKNILALKNKKIGDATYGAGVHDFKYNNVLRLHLEKAGLKDKQDFEIVEYQDANDELAALAAGKIDVAKVFPPADIDFERKHPDYVRVPFAKFFPYLPCCRQVITRSQLKDHRSKYVRLLRASIRAHEFTVQHPKETAEILARALGMSSWLVRQAIMSAYVTMTPDPMRKGVELYQRSNDRITGTKTSTAEFMDTSLYRDALNSLAKENEDPAEKGYYDTMIARYKLNN